MDPFFLKKLISNLVHVVPALFIGLLLAILLLRVFPKFARTLLVVLSLSLLALSSAPVSNAIVAPLENRYPVLQSVPDNTALVLVLGLGHHYTPARPPNSVLMAGALSRLSEAVRLVKTNEKAKLLVSGAKFRSQVAHAEAMAAMAIELGIDESRIVYASDTLDTGDEIAFARQWMEKNADDLQELIVVSSATHLTRAAMLLEGSGIKHTMAPTDFRMLDAPWYRFSAYHLQNVDFAVHEYVGMLWYKLK